MFKTIRSILFLLPAEQAHTVTMKSLKVLHKLGLLPILLKLLGVKRIQHTTLLMGLRFTNKVGLAAGFDKNADYMEVCDALGFGFVEIGTVTPLPQAGNDKPRLFRLPQDHGLINRMGFNNKGVEAMAERLKRYRHSNPLTNLIIGGNIGKNKITPNEIAHNDYATCYKKLYPYVDYFVVNVSSPNTPDLRALQDKEPLRIIFKALKFAETEMHIEYPDIARRPILVKISPDNGKETVDDILDLVREFDLAGVVSSNTTIRREGLLSAASEVEAIGSGGLSGRPVRSLSDNLIGYMRSKDTGIVIMGVGGIESAADAMNKQTVGADVVQIYTGFIYAGPKLISEAANVLAKES